MDGIDLSDSGSVVRNVMLIPVAHITPLWDRVEPLVERGLRGEVTHDTEDVRRILMAQSAQLWGQFTASGELEAVCVSEFAVYPKGIWVRVWLGAVADGCEFDDQGFCASL